MKEKIRMRFNYWVKKFFDLYDICDLTIGGHCGCCGAWIPDEIFPKIWTWGVCKKCQEN